VLQPTAGEAASLSRAVPAKVDEQAAWRKRLSDLTQEQERLEAELSAQSAAFRQATAAVTLDELLAALPAGAVLVDYLDFERSTPPKRKGESTPRERQLVAFVVRNAEKAEDRVTMVPLGPAEPLGPAIDAWRKTYGVAEEGAAAGKLLREAVWQPLVDHLGDAQTILVSTDGVLGRLPLGALPGSKKKYLIEERGLAMIPVPQLLPALVAGGGKREHPHELLLLGGVDYDAVPGTDEQAAPKKKQPRRPGDRATSPADGRLFDPLPATDGEVTYIKELYGRLFEITPDDPKSLFAAEADEARFRRFAPQYRHLHLATHGFFAGEQYASALGTRSGGDSSDRAMLADRESEITGYNPGLLSGLALAGANREPTASGDDGILTSQEIGTMDLSGVDMVVLSACDTGLGQTAGGEGLLGVQRAFQVAGARTTVASFWKVDDLVTRFLMERFYRNLWEKEMSRLEALREAQLYVLDHPEEIRGSELVETDAEAKPRTSPRYWASFTLSGDWR
jgi:CHAT domain-containing protein